MHARVVLTAWLSHCCLNDCLLAHSALPADGDCGAAQRAAVGAQPHRQDRLPGPHRKPRRPASGWGITRKQNCSCRVAKKTSWHLPAASFVASFHPGSACLMQRPTAACLPVCLSPAAEFRTSPPFDDPRRCRVACRCGGQTVAKGEWRPLLRAHPVVVMTPAILHRLLAEGEASFDDISLLVSKPGLAKAGCACMARSPAPHSVKFPLHGPACGTQVATPTLPCLPSASTRAALPGD